jgi:hypothetical protein
VIGDIARTLQRPAGVGEAGLPYIAIFAPKNIDLRPKRGLFLF